MRISGSHSRRQPGARPRLIAFLALTVFGLSSLTALPAGGAHADDVTISVSPPIVEATVAPGGIVSREIAVFNPTSHPVRVSISAGAFEEGTPEMSAVDWVSVEPAQFLLAAYRDQAITVTIQVPEGDLPSGGRYAALTVDAQSVDPMEDLGVPTARAGVRLLINVAGTGPLLREALLDWFVPVMEPNGLVGFRGLLTNRGNVHLAPEGTVEISGPDGPLAARPEFNGAAIILPAKGRVLEAKPAVSLAPGVTYSARATLSFGGAAPVTADSEFTASPLLNVEGLRPAEGPDGALQFVLTLLNQGDLALRPRAQVYVHAVGGTVMGTTLATGPSLLLPGASGDMRFDLHQTLPPGDHVLVAEVYYGGPGPMVKKQPFSTGRAGAVVEPERGGNTGWYMPVGAAAGGLVLIAVIGWTPVLAPVRRRLRSAVRGSRRSR